MTPITSALLATRLVRLQVAKEVAWGTPLAATSIWHGIEPVPTLTPTLKATQFDEQRGSLTPAFIQAQLAKGGLFDFKGLATYEDIEYLLSMALGVVTPTTVSPSTITAISKENPTKITVSGTPSWIANGQMVIVAGSNSVPVVDGAYVITKINTSSFTIPVDLSAGTAGTAGTVGPPAVWTHAAPMLSAWTPQSLTMELGNVGGQAVIAAGALLQSWAITGEQQKELSFTGKGFFKSFNAAATLTGALSYRTVEPILHPQVALSLDAAAVAAGHTPITARLISFSLDGTTGLVPVFTEGAYEPTAFVYEKADAKLKLGLLYDAAMQTFLNANVVAGAPIVVQLKATSGAKALEIDYSGGLTADPVLWGDSQGAQIVEIELSAIYDATLANYLKMILTNTVATLP